MRNPSTWVGLALAGLVVLGSATAAAQAAGSAAGGDTMNAPVEGGAQGGASSTGEGSAGTTGGGASGSQAGGSSAPAKSYDHTGLWLAGSFGGYAGTLGGVYFRGEVGIPLIAPGSFGVGIQIPAYIGAGAFIVSPGAFGAGVRLSVIPGVLMEWTVFDRWGRLAVAAEVGAGLSLYAAWLGSGALPFTGVVRTAVGPRFVFPFGLLIDFRPVGFLAEVGAFGFAVAYNADLSVGYRF